MEVHAVHVELGDSTKLQITGTASSKTTFIACSTTNGVGDASLSINHIQRNYITPSRSRGYKIQNSHSALAGLHTAAASLLHQTFQAFFSPVPSGEEQLITMMMMRTS